MDQPSQAMWCITRTSTQSSGRTKKRDARSGISVPRSKVLCTARATCSSSSVSVTSWTSNVTWTEPVSRTCWYGSPSTSGKAVRSDSCRDTTSLRASRNATTFNAPDNRNAAGRLYAELGPFRFSRSQRRRCANDKGCICILTSGACGAVPVEPSPRRPPSLRSRIREESQIWWRAAFLRRGRHEYR